MPVPAIPARMRAVAVDLPGEHYALTCRDEPVPVPGPDEALIRVAAAGVNRADIMQARGLYPPPPGTPATPGLEVAGTVVMTGPGVHQPAVGERVAALLPGGGYAEYVRAAAALCLPVPDSVPLAEAAALPEALFTVWANVFESGGLRTGETLLIQGGGSGIGTTAIQMARLAGAQVMATAGGAEKCAACERLGAKAIDYRHDDLRTRVLELTEGRGVDVILDIVGGPSLKDHLAILAPGGRLSLIAVQGGPRAEINLLPILLRRLTITGSTLRSRSLAEKVRLAAVIRKRVWPWVCDGQLRAVLDRRFPLAGADDAHRYLASGQHFGKLVLTLEGD